MESKDNNGDKSSNADCNKKIEEFDYNVKNILSNIDNDNTIINNNDEIITINKNKRSLCHSSFPWLIISSGPCHSLTQTLSNKDLSKVKKKYKYIHCSVCQEFNPSTPWAEPRPRKYEYKVFNEHDNSLHHTKASALQAQANGNLLLATQTLATKIKGISDITNISHVLSEHDYTSNSNDNSNSNNDNNQLEVINTLTDNAIIDGNIMDNNNVFKRSRNKIDKQTKRLETLLTMPKPKTHATQGDLVPQWLLTYGSLRLNHKQMNDSNPKRFKKKYRYVLCRYCHDHNPSSIWANWALRKFEAKILASHEESNYHRKALERMSVNAEPIGGPLPPHPDISNNNTPAVVINSDILLSLDYNNNNNTIDGTVSVPVDGSYNESDSEHDHKYDNNNYDDAIVAAQIAKATMKANQDHNIGIKRSLQ